MKGVVDDSPREISRSLVAAAVLAVVASCCCSSLVAATTAGKLVCRFTTFSCGTSFTLIFPGSIAIGVFVCLSLCHSYIRKKPCQITSQNYLMCMLQLAVAPTSSDNNAVSYVLSVFG